MVTRRRRLSLAGTVLLVAVSVACERSPLLAPTGSVITLTTPTNALASNGSAEIVAQVLESAGTPPHSRTSVTFTTTLGRVEPTVASTDSSGRVTVRFFASGLSGTAVISATSGGASTGAAGSVRIVIGSAAVGRVNLSANPNPVASSGGVTTLLASVVDINGNALGNVPVSFTTSSGSLGSSLVTTDGSGSARTTLITSAQATVTATVGVQAPAGGTGTGAGTGTGTSDGAGSPSTQATASITVNVNPLPTVSITAPSGTLIARSPITFTLSVAPGASSAAQIRQVNVDFSDGTILDLGAVTGTAITVGHRFERDGTYVVRVTASDTLGGVTQAATAVVIQPEPPLAVALTSTAVVSGSNTIYTFTSTVTPSTETVSSYYWTFDGGSSQVTTGPQIVFAFPTGSGPHYVTVTVTTTTGRTATGQVVVNS